MSEVRLKTFLQKVIADSSLEQKLKVAAIFNIGVRLTIEGGFMYAADELKKAL